MNNYPKYKCHKVVSAFKILRVGDGQLSFSEGNHPIWNLWPVDHDLDPVEVSAAWMEKNKVDAGGYYVLYEDGYASFSPAKAFEDGYTKVKQDSKFDKIMRRVALGLIYAAIAAGVGLLFGNVYDRFKEPGSYSFVNEVTGATCIVLVDKGQRVMSCMPASPKPAVPETTHTTITIKGDDLLFPESRT